MYIIPTPLPHGECGVWGRAPIIKQGVFATIFTRITTAANNQSAQKAAWYKFKGGKQKTDALKKQAKAFWKNNKAFGIELSELLDLNFKDPMTEAEINAFALEKGISGFDIKFIDHLE